MQSEAPVSGAPAPKGLKMAGIVAAIVAVGVVAAGTISRAHDTSDARHWSDARSIPTVHLVTVKQSAASDALNLPGTMQAWNAAKLYARVGGYLRAWYRDIGAEVPAGAPLGQIDTPELDQQIAQARADVTSARANAALSKSTAARWNDLLTTNSVSKQEADEKNGDLASKNAAVQAAQANLDRLLASKAFATVRAPFAGVVTARNADIGDLVGPGATTQQPLFAVADVHKIRVYVSVPQAYSASMTQGLSATLTLPDYPGKTYPAHVVGNSGAINTQTGTFEVQLLADNPGEVLKPGGYAQVRFDVPGQAGTVQIPSSALVFRAQGTQVALIGPNDHIRMQSVTLGRDLGGTVEVMAGLGANAKIVDNPPDSLAQGELVRIGDGTHG
jgi:RND family efflux transporter MFP subunit